MGFWKKTGLVLLAIVFAGAVFLAVFLAHGFRANSEPPRVEAVVARAIRNWSIPRHERQARNPMPSSSEVLEQGRLDFQARCSVCHGIDGSGRTALGRGLYPRVPDLRCAKTQSLSDGDLHYIIENGVQLTGMPAWASRHSETPIDAWKLTAFIRTLGAVSQPQQSEQANLLASASYVGSEACQRCHQEIYSRWKKTPMANVVRDPRAHPDAIISDMAHNNVARFTRDQVAFAYGSIWKQRYFTKVGDDYFPLDAQWVVGKHEWLPYRVPAKGADWWAAFYPPDNRQRPTGPTCDGCHSVGYDIHTKQVAEWNVGCERCHGPGSEHVRHPSRSNIVNAAQMDYVAASDTCIQCHSQGRPLSLPIEGKYYDWPVGYRVGLRLRDFWRLEDCTAGQTDFFYFPDCTAHKNRMQGNDFVQSVMYRRGVTCFSCHDVHGTSNYAQLRKPAAQLCLDCHGAGSPNGPRAESISAHTHHQEGSAGSQCVACHMPAIESEGVPGASVHAHTFRFISPAMTDKYKIPNPCIVCHQDKSNSWAQEQMSRWNGPAPWRVE